MFALLEILIKVFSVGFISLLVAANVLTPKTPVIYQQENVASEEKTATTSLSILLATSTKEATPEISASSTSSTLQKVEVGQKTTSTTPKNIVKETLRPIVEEKLNLSIKPSEEAIKPATQGEVNELARSAVVNILCYTESGGILRPLTGSGIIIDERGVVLTNAHLAQYFLLRDYPFKNNVDCQIRTGSPAKAAYRGELLYISPPWIEENRKNIIEENPLGTGENDFGLILITSTIDKSPSPSTFPFVSYDNEEPNEKKSLGDSYVIVGYPAGFLGSITVLQNLYISSTVSQIKQFFTFKSVTLDLMSLGGSILAQKGSSGGAVVRISDKKLVGIIVTTTSEDTTSARDLRAITMSHINRSIGATTNKTLSEYLLGDLLRTANDFRISRFSYLKNLLVQEIENR